MSDKELAAPKNKLNELWSELHLVLTGSARIVDALLPALVFLILNAAWNFNAALWGSLLAAGLLGFYRLVKRQPLLSVGIGFGGAALTVALALLAGGLHGYILPDLVIGAASVVLALLSVLVRRPLVAFTSRVARRWPLAWYWHPRVRPAYDEVTLAWAVFFAARLGLDIVLAQSQDATLLAFGKLLTGWPATIILLVLSYLYGTWRLGRLRGPSVEEFRAAVEPPWQGQKRGF